MKHKKLIKDWKWYKEIGVLQTYFSSPVSRLSKFFLFPPVWLGFIRLEKIKITTSADKSQFSRSIILHQVSLQLV